MLFCSEKLSYYFCCFFTYNGKLIADFPLVYMNTYFCSIEWIIDFKAPCADFNHWLVRKHLYNDYGLIPQLGVLKLFSLIFLICQVFLFVVFLLLLFLDTFSEHWLSSNLILIKWWIYIKKFYFFLQFSTKKFYNIIFLFSCFKLRTINIEFLEERQ